MRGLILLLIVATVGCEKSIYELGFNSAKTYVYNYEGIIMIGHQEKNLIQSGLKMTCTVEISGVAQQTFLLKVTNPSVEEFHGILAKDRLTLSPKLTQKLVEQLAQPIKFEYIKGRVGAVYATADVSGTVLNIVKGILSFLQVTVISTKKVYNLQEPGIQGICHTSYVLEDDKKANEIKVTRSIDLNNCKEKAMKVLGMAYAPAYANHAKIATNARGAVTYNYIIKPTPDGSLITKAYAQELQEFAPVDINGGSSMIEVSKKLILVDVTEMSVHIPSVPLVLRGSLKYKFGSELNQIPLLLMKTDNLEAKITEVLHRLVQRNQPQVDALSPTDYLQFCHLLRVANLDEIEAVWKKFSGKKNYRRWILDSVVTIPNINVLRFLKSRIEKTEITEYEAFQAFIVTFHLMTADSEAIQLSKTFLHKSFIKSSTILQRTMTLLYASMVYRYCVDRQDCPPDVLEPLHNLVDEAISKANEEQMILALKALGNAGQPSTIKFIRRFLPGFNPGFAEPPVRVQNEAVLALRNIAIKAPRIVQEIVLPILMDRDLHTEIRTYASLVMFETRPSLALVSTIAEFLLKETNLQVASFCYSQMKALSKSSTPDNRELAAACNVAVKMLRYKLDQLSYRYSKASHFDYFQDSFQSGVGSDFYMMSNDATDIPTIVMHRLKTYFIGTVSDPWEIGFRTEGFKTVIKDSSFTNKITDRIQNVAKMLSQKLFGYKSNPAEAPMFSAYMKYFGQEIFYADINMNTFHKIREIVSTWTGKDNPMQIVERLLNGIELEWNVPYLASEIRYIESTSLGLPVENSQYYMIITGVSINAQTQIHPAPTDGLRISQLLNSNIEVQQDSMLSLAKDLICFHGINTDLIQVGSEYHAELRMALPLKFDMKLNIRDMKFRSEMPPLQQANKLIEFKSQVFSVLRNVENLAHIKKHLILPGASANHAPKQHFEPSDKAEGDSAGVVKGSISDEILSQDDGYTGDQNKVTPQLRHLCTKAPNFGVEVCLETKVANAIFIRDCPLYHFLGDSYARLIVQPVQTDANIEKIQFKINAGSEKFTTVIRFRDVVKSLKESNATSSSSSSSSASIGTRHHGDDGTQWLGKDLFATKYSSSSSSSSYENRRGQETPGSRVMGSGRKSSHSSSSSQSQGRADSDGFEDLLPSSQEFIGDSVSPLVVAVIEAVTNDGKVQGYEAAAYLDPNPMKDNIHLLVFEINEGSKWKMCADAGPKESTDAVMAMLRWGQDCEDYKIKAKAALLNNPTSNKAIQLKVQWEKVPRYLKKNAERFADYVPGVFWALGFFEEYERNPAKQISLTIKATSSNTIETLIKAPKMSLYQAGIPVPINIPSKCLSDTNMYPCTNYFKNLPNLFVQGMKAHCSVTGNNFITFNNVRFTSPVPKGCYHVLAQDCTGDLNFLVLMKEEANRKQIDIRTPIGNINMYLGSTREHGLVFNNAALPLSLLPFKDPSGTLLISSLERGLLVEAPALGLDRVYFSGDSVKVAIQPWMTGKTCGLCGHADGEKLTEFRMPNVNTAKSPNHFVHSWLLRDESCSSACNLQQDLVTLEKHITKLGVDSKCFSVEPLLRCRSDCSVSETTPVSVGFHCVPISSGPNEEDSELRRSENTQIKVDAHIACHCSPRHCS
ncbi:vitellogenin isoform X2 [Amia ocellicauda]|uniref:vitellogenin isoform X2 n=1 Tax=Amia ocellicauda TaxID=2972642 RepID=UPI0034640277